MYACTCSERIEPPSVCNQQNARVMHGKVTYTLHKNDPNPGKMTQILCVKAGAAHATRCAWRVTARQRNGTRIRGACVRIRRQRGGAYGASSADAVSLFQLATRLFAACSSAAAAISSRAPRGELRRSAAGVKGGRGGGEGGLGGLGTISRSRSTSSPAPSWRRFAAA